MKRSTDQAFRLPAVRVALVLIGSLIGPPSGFEAQEPVRLMSDDRVRGEVCSGPWRSVDPAMQRSLCDRLVGHVRSIGNGSVLIERDDGQSLDVALTSFRRLQVQRGEKSNLGWGLVIGASTGLLAGRVYCGVQYCGVFGGEPDDLSTEIVTMFGLAGGLVGMIVGSFIKTDRWVGVPVDRFDASFLGGADSPIALGLTIRF